MITGLDLYIVSIKIHLVSFCERVRLLHYGSESVGIRGCCDRGRIRLSQGRATTRTVTLSVSDHGELIYALHTHI